MYMLEENQAGVGAGAGSHTVKAFFVSMENAL